MVFADLNEEWAKASSEESVKYASAGGYETNVFRVDVRDAKSVGEMVGFVVQRYGRVDYCVNAAGVSVMAWAVRIRCGNRASHAILSPATL